MIPKLVLGLLATFGGTALAPVQQPGSSPTAAELEGRHCSLCGEPLADGDVQVRHRGRSVPLCAGDCHAAFVADPDRHFASSSPRGSFLQEHPEAEEPVRRSWFWLGVWVVSALTSAAAGAYLAIDRARPAKAWFVAGLVGNVPTVLALALAVPRGDTSALPAGVPRGLGKVPTTRRPRPCERCGRSNHPAARCCVGCGAELEATAVSEVQSARGGTEASPC